MTTSEQAEANTFSPAVLEGFAALAEAVNAYGSQVARALKRLERNLRRIRYYYQAREMNRARHARKRAVLACLNLEGKPSAQ